MADDNALLQIIKTARLKGKSFLDIEMMYKIPAVQAEMIFNAHYSSMKIDPLVFRMMQLERLESLIDVLMSMAQMGNVKSADVLLKTLDQINNLLGINLQQTKVEITLVDDRQSQALFRILVLQNAGLLKYIQANVKDQDVLTLIEENWDEVADNSYTEAIEAVVTKVSLDQQ